MGRTDRPPGRSGVAWKPTRDQLAAAYGKTVRDVIAPDLNVLFVGINPGLYSGAVGHHFARPGNRFWKTLHRAGFTDEVLSPFAERELPGRGVGITNLVTRATANADELTVEELRTGFGRVRRVVCRLHPAVVAFLGVTAYRLATGERRATIGEQSQRICRSRVWVLPNPSGRTAAYQLDELAGLFASLREGASRPSGAAEAPSKAAEAPG
jgi:TDG/mug DNA glycosylase family protein